MRNWLRGVTPKKLLMAQGLYYLITGLWPLFAVSSFQFITGEKTDLWLVKTAGLLVAVAGAVLVRSALRVLPSPDAIIIACGYALVLAAVDIIYTAKGVISPVYLVDAFLEIAIISGWSYCAYQGLAFSYGQAEYQAEPEIHSAYFDKTKP